MNWKEIKRDKKGLATEECLNEMFKHTRIAVTRIIFYRSYIRVIKKEDQDKYREEIKKDKDYTYYLPIN